MVDPLSKVLSKFPLTCMERFLYPKFQHKPENPTFIGDSLGDVCSVGFPTPQPDRHLHWCLSKTMALAQTGLRAGNDECVRFKLNESDCFEISPGKTVRSDEVSGTMKVKEQAKLCYQAKSQRVPWVNPTGELRVGLGHSLRLSWRVTWEPEYLYLPICQSLVRLWSQGISVPRHHLLTVHTGSLIPTAWGQVQWQRDTSSGFRK